MPDLSHDGVHKFWKDYPDPMIYRVVSFMEAVEQWPLDGDQTFENAVAHLATELDTLGNYEVGKPDDLISLCCHLKTARALRLLQSLDIAHPGAASKLLIHAEEKSQSHDDLPGLFLRRNIVFERLRLLSRLFSAERFALILKALENEDE
jgi:intracellular multiplication protein IcmW